MDCVNKPHLSEQPLQHCHNYRHDESYLGVYATWSTPRMKWWCLIIMISSYRLLSCPLCSRERGASGWNQWNESFSSSSITAVLPYPHALVFFRMPCVTPSHPEGKWPARLRASKVRQCAKHDFLVAFKLNPRQRDVRFYYFLLYRFYTALRELYDNTIYLDILIER